MALTARVILFLSACGIVCARDLVRTNKAHSAAAAAKATEDEKTRPALLDSSVIVRRGKARFAQLDESTINSNTFELLAEVEKMVEMRNADPNKIKIIKELVNEQLIPALTATHKSGQQQIDRRLEAIEQCEKTTETRVSEIENTTKKQVEIARTGHKTCRTTEAGQKKTKQEKCMFLEVLRDPTTQPRDTSDTTEMLKYSNDEQKYWCSQETQIKQCKQAVDDLSITTKSCGTKQRQFETDMCTMAVQLKGACEDLSQECYLTAMNSYSDTVRETKELVAKWKTEYSAMKKISCFIDVWLGDDNPNTASADKLQQCKNTNPDDSTMDINYGTPGKQYQCKDANQTSYPGSPGFLTNEYAAFKDLVDEVVPCLAVLQMGASALQDDYTNDAE